MQELDPAGTNRALLDRGEAAEGSARFGSGREREAKRRLPRGAIENEKGFYKFVEETRIESDEATDSETVGGRYSLN